jgi:hypothetical protein
VDRGQRCRCGIRRPCTHTRGVTLSRATACILRRMLPWCVFVGPPVSHQQSHQERSTDRGAWVVSFRLEAMFFTCGEKPCSHAHQVTRRNWLGQVPTDFGPTAGRQTGRARLLCMGLVAKMALKAGSTSDLGPVSQPMCQPCFVRLDNCHRWLLEY